MVTVIFLPADHGASTEQVGSANIFAIPLENKKDFTCTPKGIISFDEAQQIARLLDNDHVIGKISNYEWRKDVP